MATAREIQVFRDLIWRWIDQDRVKTLITKSKEPVTETVTEEPIWLAQKSLISWQEFIDEGKKWEPLVEWEEWFIWPEQTEQTKQTLEEEDEWLTWFISETGEALKERWAAFKDIKERFDVKIWWARQRIREAWEWKPFILKTVDKINQSFKEEFNKIWSSFQVAWQIIWAWGDILWEWIENSLQEITPAKAEQAIENVVKKNMRNRNSKKYCIFLFRF